MKNTPVLLMTPGRGTRSGVALVITLAVLVLITVIVVGLLQVARVDRGAAHSQFEQVRADAFARMAEEEVVATLQEYTSGASRVWASQPGGLIVPSAGGAPEVIPLHSGLGTASDSPNVNIPSFQDPANFLVTGRDHALAGSLPMPVAWVYVREDGSFDDTNPPNLTDTANPVVGRFAYWTDDESTKLNYNLAWTRRTTNGPQPPIATTPELASVFDSLGIASPADTADALRFHLSTDRFASLIRPFYSTPFDARRISDDVSSALGTAHFDLTHYAHEQGLTVFDKPRIVLTTQANRAQGRPFLDILNTPNSDPGRRTSLNYTKVNETVNQLVKYLGRADWPMAPGRSFQAKYFENDPSRLVQLALNIIDYVRSKESVEEAVDPIRGQMTPGGFTVLDSANTASAFVGIARGPRMTEAGIWIDGSPAASGNYACRIKVEVHLPLDSGLESVDLRNYHLYVYTNPELSRIVNEAHQRPADDVLIGTARDGFPPDQIEPGPILEAGGYVTVTRFREIRNRPITGELSLQVALSRRAGVRIQMAPIVSTNRLVCPVDPPETSENEITSIEIDDPNIHQHRGDWKLTAGNTFGQANSIWSVGNAAPGMVPPIDTDSGGAVTNISHRMPYPRGHSLNPQGIVTSLGELGFIHTGQQGGGHPGVPWRSVRLQRAQGGELPDWALWDLFALPVNLPDATSVAFTPQDHSISGKINLNAALTPFDLRRTLPLQAALVGAANRLGQTLSTAQASDLVERIAARQAAQPFLFPGEVLEVPGIADGGEESEMLVRELGGLLGSRSNVFSVYAIGQALRQTPDGQINVTATQRYHAILERIGIPPLNDHEPLTVRVRSIYQRNLGL